MPKTIGPCWMCGAQELGDSPDVCSTCRSYCNAERVAVPMPAHTRTGLSSRVKMHLRHGGDVTLRPDGSLIGDGNCVYVDHICQRLVIDLQALESVDLEWIKTMIQKRYKVLNIESTSYVRITR